MPVLTWRDTRIIYVGFAKYVDPRSVEPGERTEEMTRDEDFARVSIQHTLWLDALIDILRPPQISTEARWRTQACDKCSRKSDLPHQVFTPDTAVDASLSQQTSLSNTISLDYISNGAPGEGISQRTHRKPCTSPAALAPYSIQNPACNSGQWWHLQTIFPEPLMLSVPK